MRFYGIAPDFEGEEVPVMPAPPRVLSLIFALVLTGCATVASDTATSTTPRVLEISMTDLAFTPEEIDLASGEEVLLRFINDGALPHDAFIGDEAAQADHEQEMVAMSGMDHGSSDPSTGVTVQPGETVDVPFTAMGGGTLIGCHQPGHYAAGMVLEVRVA